MGPADRPPTDTLEDRQVAQQLADAEARLVERYRGRGGISEERVRGVFSTVIARFEQARIRSFLPILVERAVHAELGR